MANGEYIITCSVARDTEVHLLNEEDRPTGEDNEVMLSWAPGGCPFKINEYGADAVRACTDCSLSEAHSTED